MIKIALTSSTEPQNFYIRTRYTRVLMELAHKAGFFDVMPVVLPIVEDPWLIRAYAEEYDGFIFTGGDDVDPAAYGEEKLVECGEVEGQRDAFKIALLREIIALKKPVFGICRGMQIMNVALGGSLWQDIPSQRKELYPDGTAHCTKDESGATHHGVFVDGFLRELSGRDHVMTNSYHHQSVKEPGDGLRIVAHSDEGIVEAFEHTSLPYFRAVQWHPEVDPDEISQALYAQFLTAVRDSMDA